MRERERSLPRWLSMSAGVGITFVVLVSALVVQHFRHRWPFSLHHGLPVTREEQAPTVSTPLAEMDHAAHARAPVELDPSRREAMGVRTEPAVRETVSRPIRAVATVVADESRVSHVHTRVAGWIEELYVSTTGQRVRAGDPLAGIFSQELFSSQTEYLSALRASSSGPRSALAEAARTRLKVFGMTEVEILELEERGEPMRLTTVVAPRSGVVFHRGISVGTAVDPSTEIVSIADLSKVWLLAEIPEADIPEVRQGERARLEFPSSGRAPFEARVEFVYPTLSERTRTLRVRFVVDNSDGGLRPGLYGTAEFQVGPRRVLTVPRDAVVDTGLAQHVFVAAARGGFEPRTIELGVRLGDRVEVREGLVEGEEVVSSGVFLIDSESRLRASGGGGATHAGHGGARTEGTKGEPEEHRH
ncbi:MAG TPA: efflux RND transporter periplasmic adaptor subunit [Vicinamibacteria bacterium]|jgi:Cu(I)/Ag(I) efflux system membrane fusion protein